MVVYDTTLRDGAQGQGVSFSLQDKLTLIRHFDRAGFGFIEAGNPAANPADAQLFARLKGERLNAHLTAFGSTRHAGRRAEEDGGLNALLRCGAPWAALFGKAWDFHVSQVLRTTLEENLNMIGDSIEYLTRRGVQVAFDAEHFFDGYRAHPAYALSVLERAQAAGARWLVLCDTNGGTLPEEVKEAVQEVVSRFGPNVGIHCHNDSGLAAAASLAAVRAGAGMVQGAVNGLGERCGNADLCTLLPNLTLKMGVQTLPDLTGLTELANLVASVANIEPDPRRPYVGASAFAHKGGMHIDGVMKNPLSFEHVRPEAVGNSRNLLISGLSGRTALLSRVKAVCPQVTRDSQELARIQQKLKRLESEGYHFEDAPDSFALLVRKELGLYQPFFHVEDFRIFSQRPEDDTSAMAMIKVSVDGKQEVTAAEGDGPVNALDLSLRKALSVFYPCISGLRLVDFKVRVVGGSGTASRVRVHIASTDGARRFGTVGVSNNILQAAWLALVDSIEAMLAARYGPGGAAGPPQAPAGDGAPEDI